MSRFFVENLFVSQWRKISLGNTILCHYIRESKNFMLQRFCHVFPKKLFCLTVPRILVGEPFCAVFSKIPVAKKFMDKRVGEL